MNYCPNCGAYLVEPQLPKRIYDVIAQQLRELPIGSAVANGYINSSLKDLHTALTAAMKTVAVEAMKECHK